MARSSFARFDRLKPVAPIDAAPLYNQGNSLKSLRSKCALGLPLLWAALSCLFAASPVAAQQTSRTLWVAADFDGDHKVDLVSFNTAAGLAPRIQVCPDCTGAFNISTLLPMNRLRARDLDGDDDRDLVLETLSSVPLAVWINDGAGNFTRGNLEEFRKQLSPRESRSADAVRVLPASDAADDCPRGDSAAPWLFSAPEIVSKRLGALFDTVITVLSAGSVRLRGPPSSL